MKPWVIMRSHNDMPLIRETLAALAAQRMPFDLLALDNDSSDGTAEEIKKYTDRIITVPRGGYVPGRVLNQGMESTRGELTVFLNSDCVPQGTGWLGSLLEGFEGQDVAAVFGRQIPRPHHHPLHQKDTEEAYGAGERQDRWHCFSMAASAIRRSLWEKERFSGSLRYSEDIEWTWRLRQKGCAIRYVPGAVAMHSHDYTPAQFYERHFGEGMAEASIFDWSPWRRSFLRYSLLPCARQIVSDLAYCAKRGVPAAALHSPVLRLAQLRGRRRGFVEGFKGR